MNESFHIARAKRRRCLRARRHAALWPPRRPLRRAVEPAQAAETNSAAKASNYAMLNGVKADRSAGVGNGGGRPVSSGNAWNRHTAVAIVLVLATLLLASAPAIAQDFVQEFYVPVPDQDAFNFNEDINTAGNAPFDSTIS
ncbi:MAG: hypothetical protein GTN86_03470, partial [Xanthomonadales bacterium]|nr:hypothetical protein [Xanthomonadales bacterium]NIN59083.1 hypothetical protein [Xanthomonadales bacterium]NIN74394.1 hypothetical protein [Xanthomonadales bacterium]NIO12466.1 hypothetical protein [Xanthomonadales bacterium]NIP11476.1 hypothetical protein [Xanthomonadales bacterium]